MVLGVHFPMEKLHRFFCLRVFTIWSSITTRSFGDLAGTRFQKHTLGCSTQWMNHEPSTLSNCLLWTQHKLSSSSKGINLLRNNNIHSIWIYQPFANVSRRIRRPRRCNSTPLNPWISRCAEGQWNHVGPHVKTCQEWPCCGQVEGVSDLTKQIMRCEEQLEAISVWWCKDQVVYLFLETQGLGSPNVV